MTYELLVKKIAPSLRGIAYRLTRKCPFCSYDDLYQEALIHLWDDFRKGRLSDKTDSYILQGCYFYLKNYIRKNSNKARIISIDSARSDEDGLNLAETILNLESPGSLLNDTHCRLLIEQINNNGLTSQEKQIFNFALEGLTVREIGSRMGISHVRVVRLRQRIAGKCLKHFDKI